MYDDTMVLETIFVGNVSELFKGSLEILNIKRIETFDGMFVEFEFTKLFWKESQVT